MKSQAKKKADIEKLVLSGILTAIVVVLQYLGSFIKFGPFSISLILIPIVIGAATCSTKISAWLGFVFGVVVLLTGDAAAFLTVDVFGTILTVLLKGSLAGATAGLVYKALSKKNDTLAVITAAVATPIVNTGIFLLGCCVFFMDTVSEWAAGMGYESVGAYMILGLVGINFIIEFSINLILNPIIVRLIKLGKRSTNT